MTLVLPDEVSTNSVEVQAWLDAAAEEGLLLDIVTDSQLLSLGSGAAARYPGLIVPDQIHVRASDSFVLALQNYVNQGGRLMVVFDAAALTETGFYAIPKSRLSELVGVDYVLYDELRDRTVGLGPVQGLVATLRTLQVPPGKSMPPEGTASTGTSSTGTATTTSSRNGPATAVYLPSSPSNPGGLKRYDHYRYHRDAKQAAKHYKQRGPRDSTPYGSDPAGQQRAAKRLSKVNGTSRLQPALIGSASVASTSSSAELHTISGYGYGPLTYPSYVTRGQYVGQVLLSSADHGLVAGHRTVGAGEVLFVNLPLTYLKLATDGLPMHGFLRYFANTVLKMPRLLAVPDGQAGMTLNWHLDSNLALQPMRDLKSMGVFKDGPFSMHLTAGPDTVTFGDGIGFDLLNNPEAQNFLREFDAQGHQVGSHGGWIHDYYGDFANETNQSEFLQYLILNRDAVDSTVGHPTVEYSAPQGNNPLWALNWLEQQGVRSYYFLGHTGLGATRSWRENALRNPSMWAIPLTPFGRHATFEDFEEANLPAETVLAWYKELIDFTIEHRTNRMIYMHPPGAVEYPSVVNDLLQYAREQRSLNRFRWYTMNDLAVFMKERRSVTWTLSRTAQGTTQLDASHPITLKKMTWQLPKSAYARPSVVIGNARIEEDANFWIVRVRGGKKLQLVASSSN